MPRKLNTILAVLLASAVLPAAAADAPAVVKIPRLTLEAAQKLASATVAACRKDGLQVGVTVVDRNGDAMVVMRDTLAAAVTLEVSRQKAYTAVNFNAATSALKGRFPEPHSVGKVTGLVFSAGGLPIEAVGNIVAGVGVSGAPSGEQDEACAREGLKAIQFDLETASL